MTTHCQYCTTTFCTGCREKLKSITFPVNVMASDPYKSEAKFFAGYHPVYDFKKPMNELL